MTAVFYDFETGKGRVNMSVKKGLTSVSELYRDAERFGGRTVKIGGWVRTIRSSNAFGFIELNDGTYFSNLQVVIEDALLPNYNEITKQNVGASLLVEGTLVLTPGAKQPFELKASAVTVLGASSPEFPLQPKKHSFEFLRTIAHRVRAPTPSTRCSACARLRRRPFTPFSPRAASFMYTRPSLRPATPRARAKCSA